MAEETQEGAGGAPAGAKPATPDGGQGDQGQQQQDQQQAQRPQEQEPPDGHFSSRFADADTKKLAARYNSEEDMAKALRDANREMSTRIKPLSEDASDEDRSKWMENFRSAMNLPKDVDGYEVQRPEALDEELFNSEPVQAKLADVRQLAFEHGAPPGLVQALLEKQFEWDQAEAVRLAEQDAAHEKELEKQLRSEWGSNYDANKAVAEEFAAQQGAPDIFNLELKGAEGEGSKLLGSYAPFVKLMAIAGRVASEGGLQAGISGTAMGESLQQKYQQLTEDIAKANQEGDSKKAQDLANQRREVSLKLHGNAGPVGAGGRRV
jgi:hypothetical protein